MPSITTVRAHETELLGEAVGSQLRPGDLVLLSGDLGTGKTTFVKGVARALGITEAVTSPTFTIVQEYEGGRHPLAHVDVYRLERVQELHDLGFEELFEGRVVVIEWGETIARLLPADRLEVRIIQVPDAADDERSIEIAPQGTSWATRHSQLDDALRAVRTS